MTIGSESLETYKPCDGELLQAWRDRLPPALFEYLSNPDTPVFVRPCRSLGAPNPIRDELESWGQLKGEALDKAVQEVEQAVAANPRWGWRKTFLEIHVHDLEVDGGCPLHGSYDDEAHFVASDEDLAFMLEGRLAEALEYCQSVAAAIPGLQAALAQAQQWKEIEEAENNA